MADMGRVYRHSPFVLGQIKLYAADIVGLMRQESTKAGLIIKQKQIIIEELQESIDRNLASGALEEEGTMTSGNGFTEEQKTLLSAKLDRSNVLQRTHAGRSLSYIEAWHAIAEANRIFGFDAWHRETVDMRLVDQAETKTRAGRDAWRVAYIAKVKVEVLSVRREGTGFGQGIDADLGLAHESAVKEAESDAMKRALMTFGNPFGLALYDKTQADVEEAKPARRRPPAGIQTPMPGGAMIEPIMPANAPAEPAGKRVVPRFPMGGPAPSLLQRASAEADKGSFAYEHFWTQEIGPEERLEIGVEMHLKLKDAAMVADRAAEGAAQ